MTLIRSVQEQLARSRWIAVAATRTARFLQGVTAYRLGQNPNQSENGESALVAAVAMSIDRFVDVGANVGDWTAELLTRRPAAAGLLVEPGRVAANACRRRFGGQVKVIEAAAGEKPGTVDFFEGPDGDPHSSVVQPQEGSLRRTVPVVTVAQVLEDEGWDTVDFVKIDAEGYDLNVLGGLRALVTGQRVGLVQFEYNDSWRQNGATLAEALALFDVAGYRTWLVARGGLWVFPYGVYGEFYRHSDFVAVHPRWRRYVEPLVRGVA
jgi:FkbM family methyltransferase